MYLYVVSESASIVVQEPHYVKFESEFQESSPARAVDLQSLGTNNSPAANPSGSSM